jgi:hypothetical protein
MAEGKELQQVSNEIIRRVVRIVKALEGPVNLFNNLGFRLHVKVIPVRRSHNPEYRSYCCCGKIACSAQMIYGIPTSRIPPKIDAQRFRKSDNLGENIMDGSGLPGVEMID